MKVEFDSNLPGLLDEVLSNQGTSVLRTPILLTKKLLSELAELAIEIDDNRLNLLMLRLGLYEFKSAADRVRQIKVLERKIYKGVR